MVIEMGIKIDFLANIVKYSIKDNFFVTISCIIQCTSTFNILFYHIVLPKQTLLKVDTMGIG